MGADEIISRCTRDGVIAWSHVARQLGRSVDSVRAQYDPGYERAYCWAPSREPTRPAEPEDLIEPPFDEDDMSSPYVRGPGLKLEILYYLTKAPASVETIANRLNKTALSIRKRLNDMAADLLVCHDDAFPRTWALTQIGEGYVTAHAFPERKRA